MKKQTPINYRLKRTNRRPGSYRLTIEGGVPVFYAPRDCPLSFIEEEVEKHRHWIEEQLARYQKSTRVNTVLYLGREYPLKIQTGSKSKVEFIDDTFFLTTQTDDPQKLYKLLLNWFIAQALETIPPRITAFAEKVGSYPKKVTFRLQKTRWGSCSTNGNINLNLKLMMAPEWIFNYVIIHELCHLQIPNHSSQFWDLVARHCPRYQEARTWLKANGASLDFEKIRFQLD